MLLDLILLLVGTAITVTSLVGFVVGVKVIAVAVGYLGKGI